MGFEAIYKLSVVLSMVDRLTSPIRGVGSEIQGTMGKINGMSQSFGNMITGGAAMAAAGTQIAEGVLQPVAATFETQGIRRIVESGSQGPADDRRCSEGIFQYVGRNYQTGIYQRSL